MLRDVLDLAKSRNESDEEGWRFDAVAAHEGHEGVEQGEEVCGTGAPAMKGMTAMKATMHYKVVERVACTFIKQTGDPWANSVCLISLCCSNLIIIPPDQFVHGHLYKTNSFEMKTKLARVMKLLCGWLAGWLGVARARRCWLVWFGLVWFGLCSVLAAHVACTQRFWLVWFGVCCFGLVVVGLVWFVCKWASRARDRQEINTSTCFA